MKIGVITWFGTGNFGTDLQSYALCHYLIKQGHEAKLIPMFLYKEVGIRYTIRRFLGYYKRLLSMYITATNAKKARHAIVKQYIKEVLPTYSLVTTKRQYQNMMDYFDCFVTGSDQIWNPYHLSKFNLLDFNKSKPSFAYASSIGVNEIPSEKCNIYKKYLSKFQAIGVREQTGAIVLKKATGRNDIVTVLDPTFLLRSSDWIKFSELDTKFSLPCTDYMLVYTIGSRKEYPQFIEKIKKHYKIDKVIIVSSVESRIHYTIADYVLDNVSPMAFIKLLYNAKLVCTDSFHATALSINMNKNFIELLRFDENDTKSQNSRIKNILNHYELNERLYQDNLPLTQKIEIDYSKANNILEKDRVFSYNFIQSFNRLI